MMRYFLFFLFAALPAYGATIYKWIDEKGITHFSQTPPPQGNAQEISFELPPPPPEGSLEKLKAPEKTKEASLEDKRRQAEEQARIRKEVCSDLQKRLETLQGHARLYTKDEKGNITWLTEEQRQKLIKETQARLKEFCSTGAPATGP
ncbi:MAG: DUF4124 domain-containing protein [Gammaproteobacteria bacterium]|nr:MAG: DUF4124 domain-containing protein [Gammaproteobacteria bacterium]